MSKLFDIIDLVMKINQKLVDSNGGAKVSITKHEIKVQVYFGYDFTKPAIVNQKIRYFQKESNSGKLTALIDELQKVLESLGAKG
ncbi:MAG: hypothetical protein RSB94_08615 [Erysipelotrichaceae bacterium]